MTSPRRTWSATRTVASPQTSSGRGRAALTRSNWGRSTFRASWKLWAPATLVRETFFDHAAETLTQYTSNAAQARAGGVSSARKGRSSGTALR